MMPTFLVSVMPTLQDHDSTEEGSEDGANERERLEVNTNQGADAVSTAGAAAAALGGGACGCGIGASLRASAVGGGEAGRVGVGTSELHQGQARDLSTGVVVNSGGHVGGSLTIQSASTHSDHVTDLRPLTTLVMAPLGAEVIPEVTRSSPPLGRSGRSQLDRKVDSVMREAAQAVVCCFSAVSLTEVRADMSILRYCSFRYSSVVC